MKKEKQSLKRRELLKRTERGTILEIGQQAGGNFIAVKKE